MPNADEPNVVFGAPSGGGPGGQVADASVRDPEAERPGRGVAGRVQPGQHRHPLLDVAPLQPSHGAALGIGRATAIRLAAQERQVTTLVRQGLSNRDAAAQLFLSPRTVEYHLHKVFGKLGIESRGDLHGALRRQEPQGTRSYPRAQHDAEEPTPQGV